jgi:L-ribulose-5-phosphate 3-epimerase
MRFGYNTNGFAHHQLEDAICILADLGYQSVALTLDVHALNPFDPGLSQRCELLRTLLQKMRLGCVVETGSRFILDPRRKHQPTLLSADAGERERRMEFLKSAIEIAQRVNADAVSLWSGTPLNIASESMLMDRLVEGCKALCDHAASRGVRLAFEPEPGMFIDTMTRFAELHRHVNHPSFGLTLDIGHLHCQGETPIVDHLRRWAVNLWNIHIEDMRHGVHDHLMFGQGEIDFGPVLRTLDEIGYPGGVHVELGRHSHDAVETARQALAFLKTVR